jgi:uncharacterized membrane protein
MYTLYVLFALIALLAAVGLFTIIFLVYEYFTHGVRNWLTELFDSMTKLVIISFIVLGTYSCTVTKTHPADMKFSKNTINNKTTKPLIVKNCYK